MLIRAAICLFATASLGLAAWLSGPDDVAAPRTATPAAQSHPAAEPVHEFVGTKRCRMCHSETFRSWNDSAKASAWDALRPHEGTTVKKRAGLATETDFTADTHCLKCHVVGLSQPGGYVPPDPTNRVEVRNAEERRHVGCEACHGPGSEYTKIMTDIFDHERKYRREELLAAGRKLVTAGTCLNCHNASAPCVAWKYEGVDANDLQARFEKDIQAGNGFHAHSPLKYRLSGE
jgi:hypothetical protein